MPVTVEKKYEAAITLLNAQVDTLILATGHRVDLVGVLAAAARRNSENWINASDENRQAFEALGEDLMQVTDDELKVALAEQDNAKKQGYPNA